MDQFSEFRRLGQMDANEAGRTFREFLRASVRESLIRVMAEEVGELCGPKHRPTVDAEAHRAGSAEGVALCEGRREAIVRPRVRRKKADGESEEVRLATYAAAQEPGQLDDMLLRALIAGASGRDMKNVHPEAPKTSRSSVSRLWAKEGAKFVEQLRTRDVASQDWVVLMLDGVRLSKEQLAVVAIGVTLDGRKQVLDFELGGSENFEVCRDLVSRLVSRGFQTECGLLAVLDGAAALKRAVRTFFPDALVQRCLVHKERNVCARLSKRDWAELARRFKRLRQVQGEQAAREARAEIEQFLEDKNAAALESFLEAGDELITLHCLNVPATLHVSLLSTNLIENSFRNVRRKLGRVTRFRAETDQASRWLAVALLEAEKGFHRIQGYRDLPQLAEALRSRTATLSPEPAPASRAAAETPLRPTAFAPPPPQHAKACP